MRAFDKIVVVTRKTRLEELIERFNTRGQAKFYLTHAGGDFAEYEQEDDTYRRALDQVVSSLELGPKVQLVDRGFVPTFLFAPEDLVVTLGQDGLVANTAKYVGAQPIVAVNPDPARFDGVLLPFGAAQARVAVQRVLAASAQVREVTLAEATLSDGQRLLAFNELFLGAHSHVSSRYRIEVAGCAEPQSSSGVIVSTGAGSTGWVSSVFNMARGVTAMMGGETPPKEPRLPWEDERLWYVVREPFVSRHSQASIVAGLLEAGHELTLESSMPSGGVIFSDGVEVDFLQFNSGATAHVRAARHKARLVVG